MSSTEQKLRVERITEEADSVVCLTLVDPDGGELPTWEPGAHVDVVLPDLGARQYSLCGDPTDRRSYRIAVLLEPAGRGGSAYIHADVRVGDSLIIRGPRNHFTLDDAPHFVFIAGGIGVTPILTMAVEAQRRGASWDMVYGGRTRSAMAFLSEMPERVQLVPEDELGKIDLDSVLSDLPEDALVYCCGPAGLIDAVRDHCSTWPNPDVVRFELFAAPDSADLDRGFEREFEVELAHTGATFTVRPGESILQKAIDAGADVGFDCEDGICGSCETPILVGEAEHRDHVLTEKERAANACMMICVSRALSERLVLDL